MTEQKDSKMSLFQRQMTAMSAAVGVARRIGWLGLGLAACGWSFLGCQDVSRDRQPEVRRGSPVADLETPREGFVKVQHILIGFEGSLPGKPITRSREEAETLAKELFQRAQDGEDFEAMVREHTDDQVPGTYVMSDFGVDPLLYPGDVIRRSGMVAAFGDVSFNLQEVGDVGMAEFDTQRSPYGWHIIKRIE